ncbi:hypothetical protein [Hyphomicrobium sp.]|mgnify:FL=1|uniref:hypothetical protein n=1 Tax=Hyphomicrobium sp. TaxID=82 RepID=UPI002B5C29BF|nr:hypothetical protein [Hyphomicrobium sp.]HRN87657.1 hypothetical protein [Hyphomicrobium sp.]HRQ27895.1 hypothetical protein [Hyphomicrobium sp.]
MTSNRPPVHPYVVLALAILLPGGGHVALGLPQRGFGFAFFSLLLALASWHTTTPDHSFVGRSAGGLFVWALSIPDAYRIARLRYEMWRRGEAQRDE